VASTTGGSRRAGNGGDPQRDRRRDRERGKRSREALLEPDGMQAAGELPELAAGQRGLLAGGGEPVGRAFGVLLKVSERKVQRLAEDDEPLLRAVVEIAPDPAALLVGGLEGAGPRCRDLDRASAQGGLVAAALDLRAGAGAEDLQRGELFRGEVQAARRDHAMWPMARPSAPRSASASVALEVVRAQEGVGG
jgi:hypothetical protein